MRTYEELFIVKPDAPEDEVDAYIGQIKEIIAGHNGEITKEEKWGVRKLAYKVQKYAEGHYILIEFSAEPDTIQEIERRMRVADLVIKYITVRTDERMKKIEKRRKHREKRAARKPPPPSAAPSEPSGSSSSAPGSPAPGAPSRRSSSEEEE